MLYTVVTLEQSSAMDSKTSLLFQFSASLDPNIPLELGT